jgi:isopenicillin-N epimerase
MEEGFPATFDWVGTRDPSAWLSISAAIAFYREMGGPDIPAYLHQTVLEARQLLQDAWQVESPAAPQQLGTMATLPLPLSGEATLERANQIRDQLWREHRIEVPLFALKDRLWIRISAQLYNVMDDYRALAVAVQHLPGYQA